MGEDACWTSNRHTFLSSSLSSIYFSSTFLFICAFIVHLHFSFFTTSFYITSSLSSSLRTSGYFHADLFLLFGPHITLHAPHPTPLFSVPFAQTLSVPTYIEFENISVLSVCIWKRVFFSYSLLRVLLTTHGPQALHCQLMLGAGRPKAVHVRVWLLPLR